MRKSQKNIVSVIIACISILNVLTVRASAQSPPMGTESGITVQSSMVSSEKLGRTIIWNYLKTEMGLPDSSVAGIISNMQAESKFRSDALGDAGRSYGLCQWHDSRCEDLIGFAEEKGKNINDLETQLAFFNEEMTTKYPLLLEALQNMPNTKEGAYKAAYDMCMKFECPEAMYASAVSRGKNATFDYEVHEKDCTREIKILCNIYMQNMKDTVPFSNTAYWLGFDLPEGYAPVFMEVISHHANETDYRKITEQPVVTDVTPGERYDLSEHHAGTEVIPTRESTERPQSPDQKPDKNDPTKEPESQEEQQKLPDQEDPQIVSASYLVRFMDQDGSIILEINTDDPYSILFPDGPEAEAGKTFTGWAVFDNDNGVILYLPQYADNPADGTEHENPEGSDDPQVTEPDDLSQESQEPESDEPTSPQETIIFLGPEGEVVATIVGNPETTDFPQAPDAGTGRKFIGWAIEETAEGQIVYQAIYSYQESPENPGSETSGDLEPEEPEIADPDKPEDTEPVEPDAPETPNPDTEESKKEDTEENLIASFYGISGEFVAEAKVGKDGTFQFPENAPDIFNDSLIVWEKTEADDGSLKYQARYSGCDIPENMSQIEAPETTKPGTTEAVVQSQEMDTPDKSGSPEIPDLSTQEDTGVETQKNTESVNQESDIAGEELPDNTSEVPDIISEGQAEIIISNSADAQASDTIKSLQASPETTEQVTAEAGEIS